jgi:hypothetical protein
VVDPRHDCPRLLRVDDSGSGEGSASVACDPSLPPPEGSGSPTYFWELCLFDQGPDKLYACAEIENVPPQLTRRELGTTPTVEVSYDSIVPDPSVLVSLCEGLGSATGLPDFIELPDCGRGIPVTLRLTAIAAGAQVGSRDLDEFCREEPRDCEIARKDFLLLRPDKVAERNHNPRLGPLVSRSVTLDPVTSTEPVCGDPAGREPGEDNDEFHDKDVVPLEVLLDLPEGSGDLGAAADFVPADGSGSEAGFETLSVSWFTTFGGIRDTTYWNDRLTDDVEITRNRLLFEPWAVDNDVPVPDGDVRIFAVIRDGRGGIDFAERRLSVPWIRKGSGTPVTEANACFDVRKAPAD